MATSKTNSNSQTNECYELYKVAYSTYLLRKLQNHLACNQKQKKEEKLKKCLISLKLEYEELLQKHVSLRKEIFHLEVFLKFMKDIDEKIKGGKEILKTLEENNCYSLLLNLQKSLHFSTSHIKLVDVSKDSFEDLINKKLLGCGSELENSLQLISEFIEKNKSQVSKIADKIREIKSLWSENLILRESFSNMFDSASNEILETLYKHFLGKIKGSSEAKDKLVTNGCPVFGNILNCKDIFKISPEIKQPLEMLKNEKNQTMDYVEVSHLDVNKSTQPSGSSTPYTQKTHLSNNLKYLYTQDTTNKKNTSYTVGQ